MNRVRPLVLLALAGLLALTGCTPPPNTAAIVNGQRVTESQIDAGVAAAARVVDADPAQIRGGVLQYTIWGVLARQIAADTKTPLTNDNIDGVIGGSPQLTLLAADSGTQALARDAASLVYLSNTVPRDAFLASLASAQITVNPRYGAWAPDQLAVTGESGSLSVASQLG